MIYRIVALLLPLTVYLLSRCHVTSRCHEYFWRYLRKQEIKQNECGILVGVESLPTPAIE
jgi:hypothetical protein